MKNTYALISLLGFVCTIAHEVIGTKNHPMYSLATFISPLNKDPESHFAIGERVRFVEVGIYELELIPRISDKLATSLCAKKSEVLKRVAVTPTQPQKAFEVVHGVGPKVATRLSEYLTLD